MGSLLEVSVPWFPGLHKVLISQTDAGYIEGITWPRGNTKFLFESLKNNTRREISYLQATMQCSVYYINTVVY